MLRVARSLRGLRAKCWFLTVQIFILIFILFVFRAHWGGLVLSFVYFSLFLSPKLGNSNGYFTWSRELGVDYRWRWSERSIELSLRAGVISGFFLLHRCNF